MEEEGKIYVVCQGVEFIYDRKQIMLLESSWCSGVSDGCRTIVVPGTVVGHELVHKYVTTTLNTMPPPPPLPRDASLDYVIGNGYTLINSYVTMGESDLHAHKHIPNVMKNLKELLISAHYTGVKSLECKLAIFAAYYLRHCPYIDASAIFG